MAYYVTGSSSKYLHCRSLLTNSIVIAVIKFNGRIWYVSISGLKELITVRWPITAGSTLFYHLQHYITFHLNTSVIEGEKMGKQLRA